MVYILGLKEVDSQCLVEVAPRVGQLLVDLVGAVGRGVTEGRIALILPNPVKTLTKGFFHMSSVTGAITLAIMHLTVGWEMLSC